MILYPKHTRGIHGIIVSLTLAVCLIAGLLSPAAAAGNTESDFAGFDSTIVRQEKARRALNKGQGYFDDRELDLARNSLTEALSFNADLHEARFLLGQVEYSDGKFKLAVAHFESLYKRNPGYSDLRLELARSYLALGDCGSASTWLERHLKNNSADKETRKLKSEIDKCAKQQEKKN